VRDLDIVIVRQKGQEGNHKDFQVRRTKILTALTWLKTNSPYYHDIIIEVDRINNLPENDILELNHAVVECDEQEPNDRIDDDDDSNNLMMLSMLPKFMTLIPLSRCKYQDQLNDNT
jgi:hypothetical protein